MKKENDHEKTSTKTKIKLGRRDFLQGLASLPVLGLFGYSLNKQKRFQKAQLESKLGSKEIPTKLSDLNVALIGVGAQGDVLLNAMLKIPNIRFVAVCDIWKEYNLKKAARLLKKYKFDVNSYEDYKEMLDKEKALDAVIIATPDFWHAQQTIDCMNAGLNVYCEKEMSNKLEDAKQMVVAAQETEKLLQIGHQRRSHPRYIHCYEKLLAEANLLGRIVTINGQWNRAPQEDIGWPRKYAIPKSTLEKYGFKSMEQFRNWRWYKGLGGGPIVDLGSHQIDIYNWFLGHPPKAVIASGGTDYYPEATHEWYDTAMVIFEYEINGEKTRAYYQTQTTNGSQGYFENFMGDQGTLVVSESEAGYSGSIYRQPQAPAWDEWVRKGYISAPQIQMPRPEIEAILDVRETISPDEHRIPIEFHDPYHKPHLENFFNSIRGIEKLNCPAEVGYETAITVLKVNEAIEAGKRLYYDPDEFNISSNSTII